MTRYLPAGPRRPNVSSSTGAEQFLAGPLASARTLVGAPPFGRRVLLTLVRTPDAVIAGGPGGIAPDLTSTTAAETPNECTERGRRFCFQGSTIADNSRILLP